MTSRATTLSLLLLGVGCRDWDQFEPVTGGGAVSGGAAAGGGGGAGTTSGGNAPVGGSGPWFDDGLASRRPIDIVHPASTETLDDFPVLLRVAAEAVTPGDVRLAAGDHTSPLAFEVERLLPNTEALIWVRVPKVGPDATRIWLYSGGVAATEALPEAETWSNGFVAVWHFESSGADALDAHSGTVTDASSAVAVVGNGLGFDGDGDRVDVPSAAAFDTLFATGGTLSAQVRPDSAGEMERGRIIDRTSDTTFGGGWALTAGDFVEPESFGFAYAGTGGFGWWVTPPQSTPHGAWHHIAATFTEGDAAPTLYVEGTMQTLTVDSALVGDPVIAPGLDVAIGARPLGDDRDYAGVIDELRASNVVRSSAWLAAEAENMAGGLVAIGDAEARQ